MHGIRPFVVVWRLRGSRRRSCASRMPRNTTSAPDRLVPADLLAEDEDAEATPTIGVM